MSNQYITPNIILELLIGPSLILSLASPVLLVIAAHGNNGENCYHLLQSAFMLPPKLGVNGTHCNFLCCVIKH